MPVSCPRLFYKFSYLKECTRLLGFPVNRSLFASHDGRYTQRFQGDTTHNPAIAMMEGITFTPLLTKKKTRIEKQNKKTFLHATSSFTLLILVHSLLAVPSFVVHYVPPHVDTSHPPVPSHSTALLL